jgi:thiamine-monophosphate kinase
VIARQNTIDRAIARRLSSGWRLERIDSVARAKPVAILVSLIWPNDRPGEQIAEFARGLGEDLRRYDVALLGGDTTSSPGPLAISITALGQPLGERVPSRGDAKAGEQVWITGPIGGAYLGLMQLTREPDILGADADAQSDAFAAQVRERYRTPSPPVAHANLIARFARASTDVSDGLIADAANIARASRVAIRLDAEAIPLEGPAHAYVAKEGPAGLIRLISAGDDYETIFTAPAEARAEINAAAKAAGADFALIGDVLEGEGVSVSSASGPLPVASAGHRHRLGR